MPLDIEAFRAELRADTRRSAVRSFAIGAALLAAGAAIRKLFP